MRARDAAERHSCPGRAELRDERHLGRGERLAGPGQQLLDRLPASAAARAPERDSRSRSRRPRRVEAGHGDHLRAAGTRRSRSSAPCSAAPRRGPPSLWSSARAAGSGLRAAAMSACSAASTSSRRAPLLRARRDRGRRRAAAAAISSGSSSSPPAMTRTRSRRSSGSCGPGRVQPRGHDRAAGRLGRRRPRVRRRVDRHPVAALQAGRALRRASRPRRARASGRSSASSSAAGRRSASAGACAPAPRRTRTDRRGR